MFARHSFISAEELDEWKEDARLAVLGAYKPVLEDGPEIFGSEASSDH
jgi:hypothetical protein